MDPVTRRSFCNGKIVGAQHFAKAAIAAGAFNPDIESASPLDGDGHGRWCPWWFSLSSCMCCSGLEQPYLKIAFVLVTSEMHCPYSYYDAWPAGGTSQLGAYLSWKLVILLLLIFSENDRTYLILVWYFPSTVIRLQLLLETMGFQCECMVMNLARQVGWLHVLGELWFLQHFLKLQAVLSRNCIEALCIIMIMISYLEKAMYLFHTCQWLTSLRLCLLG